MLEMLKTLCETPGVSGCETSVREIILREIEGCTECSVDRLGNVLAFKRGKKRAATKLMLCAHMDEVGFIVTAVTEEGLLKFAPVGGIDPRVALGRRVIIGGKTPGVIGTKAVHLQDADERKSAPPFDKLYIDIGALSKDEALAAVSPGDVAAFDSDFVEFGEGRLKARAIDDRVGCAILIDLIRSDLPYDCWFAFTVQEEVGLRGAKTAAFAVRPEAAVVIEATTAADIPNVEDCKKVCFVGRGPVLGFMDRATLYDRGLFELAREISAKKGIRSQIKQAVAGGNDSGSIHVANDGVRTLAVSLPCRYLHSPSCVISREDAEETLKLAKELTAAIAGGTVC